MIFKKIKIKIKNSQSFQSNKVSIKALRFNLTPKRESKSPITLELIMEIKYDWGVKLCDKGSIVFSLIVIRLGFKN